MRRSVSRVILRELRLNVVVLFTSFLCSRVLYFFRYIPGLKLRHVFGFQLPCALDELKKELNATGVWVRALSGRACEAVRL